MIYVRIRSLQAPEVGSHVFRRSYMLKACQSVVLEEVSVVVLELRPENLQEPPTRPTYLN